MKKRTAALVLAAFAGLAGCASNVAYEGKYARDDGWREGTVRQIAPAGSITRDSFRDCRKEAANVDADTPYVVVSFRRHGRYYSRIARLPADGQLQVGDKVYVNIDDCGAPMPKRSS